MTIVHTVLFVRKPEVLEATVDGLNTDALRAMEGVTKLHYGKNFSARAGAFTHMLVMEFTTKKALDDYMVHPTHVNYIKEVLAPVFDLAQTLAIDMEV
ncbi:hypothetical protein BC829DRAFT_385907 [Chytridium lagenaria]|nr:hypothetical protein BC829DRAFT_385907 [Chytridium lagenaria]